MQLTTGLVGVGKFESEATYALVDAINNADQDLMVTLAGVFRDASGAEVGRATRQSLRIPAGGRRTYALVDADAEVLPGATDVEVSVVGAMALDYSPPVVITEGHVYDDRGRAVVSGYVVNTADREAKAIVVAGFYDADGVPVKRPSTLFTLTGKGKRGVQFVGPEGSRSAYLFVGDVVY